jgi:hypothetical protein
MSDTLTKREAIAAQAMMGLLAGNATYYGCTSSRDKLAADAVAHADALLAELARTAPAPESKAETPAPDADGWIKWEGGECPVGPDVMVEAQLREDEFMELCIARGADLRWSHHNHRHDIIAYRVVG